MRKMVLLCSLLFVLPLAAPAWAACSSGDFGVENFEIGIDQCRGRNCPRVIIKGDLINNCDAPAAARIEIEALAGNGNVVNSVDGWPARTSNLDPGDRVSFDFTGMMTFERNMVDFSVSIVEVREW
ncbi:hypothetical protein VCB98_00160 [Gammaproteobacteria bacterium AB-CW1]|uniref:Uncharacterized protein n=1 Tax=Natronospira elongata TaxID=3110268 RepID=A0AAP6JDR6_9GAMM|nr:hypothetical protein [Gammaproteobacteria bacterium AB-CW1]